MTSRSPAAARLLEPEMAARVDGWEEEDGELPPLVVAPVLTPEEVAALIDRGEAIPTVEEPEDEFHRGEQFARRVRQRCVALLMRDFGGGEGEDFEHSYTSWFAHTFLSAEKRAWALLWLTDMVLTSIDTRKLEGAVHRFH